MKYLFTLLLIGCFLPAFVSAQINAQMLIDGNTISADPVSGAKMPIWLKESQTLARSTDVFSISVIEFSINGTTLEFSRVVTVTTVQSVPAGKAWKVESVLFATSAITPTDWSLLGNGGTSAGTNFVGTTDPQDLVFKTNSVEGMRLTASGNVGIGTSSPTSKLTVNGTTTLTGTTTVNGATTVNGNLTVNGVISGFGIVPIGTVVAWMKSSSGTTALPSGWVECNGGVLSDAASPYNGQTIPNLNGGNQFLRGNTTSTGTGGAATHTHVIDVVQTATDLAPDGSNHTGGTIITTQAASSLPPYRDVVWIIRVK